MEDLNALDITQRPPQVLLVGNGLTRSTGFSWKRFIKNCSRDDVDVGKYEKDGVFQIPNTILSLAVMECEDDKRHNSYIGTLNKVIYTSNSYINELIKLPFDSILTTNYSYEIEYAIKSDYTKLKNKLKYSNSIEKDNKYLIHTYNYFKDYPPIWHIHGEARRKSSLILSHDEYARLISKIVEFSGKRKDDYVTQAENLNMKSWIDYFILGDLYVLGFGFDFSEFDLWWLVNRRLREIGATGEIYFYEPVEQFNKYKLLAMSDIGINVETFGIEIGEKEDTDSKKTKYDEFYKKAISDITKKVKDSIKR
jgi:hypothetical protein